MNNILDNLNSQQKKAVTAAPGAGAGAGRAGLGQNPRADLPRGLPDPGPGRAPFQHPGGDVHQQGRPRNGSPPVESAGRENLGHLAGHFPRHLRPPAAPRVRACCPSPPISSSSTRTTRKTWSSGRIKDLKIDEKLYRPSIHARRHFAGQEQPDPAQRLPHPHLPRRGGRPGLQTLPGRLLQMQRRRFRRPAAVRRALLEENPWCAKNTRAASNTCWWTNSRTPTWPNTACCSSCAGSTTTCSWWATRTSRSTAGAAPITATCCASRKITRARQKILLEQNYRSTQNVLDAARAVIDRNSVPHPQERSSPSAAPGDKITLYEAVDDHAEAAYVVDTIQQLISGGQRPRRRYSP